MTDDRPPSASTTNATVEATSHHRTLLRDGETRSETTESGTDFAGEDLVIGYSTADEPVIDEETIAFPPGEVTALIGPNGSGKSTLLNGLANQLTPAAGTVLLDGRNIQELGTKDFARRLGLLSQENTSPESISVEDLVMHGRYPHRGFFESVSDQDRAAVEAAMDLAGIAHLRDREVGSLSGGQKQLAWVAMVLAQETDVLLLDEPTTFLDLHHQLEVMEIIETLRDESDITVILVLHDIEQAARYADHMVALDDGEIYARGVPTEVVTEDLLADVFGIEATVDVSARGPRITALRPLHDHEVPSASGSDSR